MASSRLRIVSFNIQALSQGQAGVVGVLTELAPDLIGLQEVDERTARSRGTPQAQVLAEALGMQAAFVAAMPYDGGEYGIAILARGELFDLRVERLPRSGSEEPRVAMLVTCRLPDGRRVRFANTHLAADWQAAHPAQLRAQQAGAVAAVLRAEADTSEAPLFLVGDFNCDSGSDALARLRAVGSPLHADLPTYPASAPVEALDHAFYVPADPEQHRVRVVEVRAVPSLASDHLPLVLDLELDAMTVESLNP